MAKSGGNDSARASEIGSGCNSCRTSSLSVADQSAAWLISENPLSVDQAGVVRLGGHKIARSCRD